MKIALLSLLGLILGALGGAALGLGACVAWVEISNTTSFEGYSGMLVFFTFMPLGALIGAAAGATIFGVLAARDRRITLEREPPRRGHLLMAVKRRCVYRAGERRRDARLPPGLKILHVFKEHFAGHCEFNNCAMQN